MTRNAALTVCAILFVLGFLVVLLVDEQEPISVPRNRRESDRARAAEQPAKET